MVYFWILKTELQFQGEDFSSSSKPFLIKKHYNCTYGCNCLKRNTGLYICTKEQIIIFLFTDFQLMENIKKCTECEVNKNKFTISKLLDGIKAIKYVQGHTGYTVS